MIGENIRLKRISANISQEELAKRLSISRVSVTNIENGKQKLSLYRFIQIADALHSSLNYLIDRKGEEQGGLEFDLSDIENVTPDLEKWLTEVGSGNVQS